LKLKSTAFWRLFDNVSPFDVVFISITKNLKSG
jgi:hypothetical protein